MLDAVVRSLEQLGPWAPFAFGLLLLISTVLPFFGFSVLIVAAGSLFGFRLGFLIVYPTSVLGACLAFKLGRWLPQRLRDRLPRRVLQLQCMLGEGGFSMLLLLRCAPLPFAASSIFLGSIGTSVGSAVPPIPLGRYAAANAIALVRLSANVLLGSCIQDLLATPDENGADTGSNTSSARLSTYIGIGSALAMLAVMGNVGRLVLKKAGTPSEVGKSAGKQLKKSSAEAS